MGKLESDVGGIFPHLKEAFIFCCLRGLFCLVAGGKARGGNPASAPNNHRLLSRTPNAGNTAWGRKKKVFGNERCPVADVFHALDEAIFEELVALQ